MLVYLKKFIDYSNCFLSAQNSFAMVWWCRFLFVCLIVYLFILFLLLFFDLPLHHLSKYFYISLLRRVLQIITTNSHKSRYSNVVFVVWKSTRLFNSV